LFATLSFILILIADIVYYIITVKFVSVNRLNA